MAASIATVAKLRQTGSTAPRRGGGAAGGIICTRRGQPSRQGRLRSKRGGPGWRFACSRGHPRGHILWLRRCLPPGPRQLVARQGRAGSPGKPYVPDRRHLFLHLCRSSVDRQGMARPNPADACLHGRRLERRRIADDRGNRADHLPARMAPERRAEADRRDRRDLRRGIPGRPDLQRAAPHLHLADHHRLDRVSFPCRAQRAGPAAVAAAAALPVGQPARHLHLRLHHRSLRRPGPSFAHSPVQPAASGQVDRFRAPLSAGHLAQPLWDQGHPRHLHGGLRQ